MSIQGIHQGVQDAAAGVYAGRNEGAGKLSPGLRPGEDSRREGEIGPAYAVEKSGGLQKPFAYRVQKDGQGNMKVLFGQGETGKPNDAFLEKVYQAFDKNKLAPGTYSFREDEKGALHIEKLEDVDPGKNADADRDAKKVSGKSGEKADRVQEAEKEDGSDDGSGWMIMELEPDPEDPHNPYKAKRRIVAQGKGPVPGVNGGKAPKLPGGNGRTMPKG